MLDIKIFRYIITIYNNFKEVIGMATVAAEPKIKKLTNAEKKSWKAIKGTADKFNPKKLPITIVNKFYEDYKLEPIVTSFKKVCDGIITKKFSSTNTLGDIKAVALTNYTKSVEPCIKKFGFTNKTTLEIFCKTILTCLKCTENVFLPCGPESLYDKFKNCCEEFISDFKEPTLDTKSLAKAVKFLLKKQTFIEKAHKEHVWDSGEFDDYGGIKDDNYEKLKAALEKMQKAYEALKTEGNTRLAKDRKKLRNLRKDIKIYDEKNTKQNELKEWCQKQFDKLMENHVAFSEYINIDPCGPTRLFIEDVRKSDKGDFTIEGSDNENSTIAVKITKKDAERRKKLLQTKHWDTIQNAFVGALKDEPLNPNFDKTKQLVDNSNVRSKRLILQLRDSTILPGKGAVTEKIKGEVVVAVENYFLDLETELTSASETNPPKQSLNFDELKRTLPNIWNDSVKIVYCISVIYEHALAFVTLLTNYLTTSTEMLRKANGTVTDKDANFKFGADILGKLATVAAFTGPLVNVSPIFAAIWGAAALSGTIVQIVQVVYNHHQAKKAAEARAKTLELQEKAAKRDDKKVEEADEPKETGDLETDNATLKTKNEELAKKNEELTKENEELKQEVASLEAQLQHGAIARPAAPRA